MTTPDMFKHILLILLASIPFSVINSSAYLKGNSPSIDQTPAPMLFIILWLLYGLIMSFRKQPIFLKLTTLYWDTGILLSILGYFANLYVIFIPAAFLSPGPIYGIRYFLDFRADILLVILSIAITYGPSMIDQLGCEVKERMLPFDEDLELLETIPGGRSQPLIPGYSI